jgi:hypothetical protein
LEQRGWLLTAQLQQQQQRWRQVPLLLLLGRQAWLNLRLA